MKRAKLLIFILFFLLACYLSSAEVTLLRNEYSSSETMQAELSIGQKVAYANLKVLDSGNNSITIAPILFELKPLQYFLYFDLPSGMEEGNYRLSVNYKKVINGILRQFEDSSYFSVTNKDSALAIKPGMIWLTPDKKRFSITLSNKGQQPIDVVISSSDDNIVPVRSNMPLQAGESKSLYVDADFAEVTGTKAIISLAYGISSYSLPIYLDRAEPLKQNCTDSIRNQDERGVDCGGTCENVTMDNCCSNGIKDYGEDGTDCGGVCEACAIIPPENESLEGNVSICKEDGLCNWNRGEDNYNCIDCMLECNNSMKDYFEEGVDCGGPCLIICEEEEEPIIADAISFVTENKEIKGQASQFATLGGLIIFRNNLNVSIQDVKVLLTGNLKEVVELSMTSVGTMNAKATKEIYMVVNGEKTADPFTSYSGNIVITSEEGYSASLPVYFEFTFEAEQEKEPVVVDVDFGKKPNEGNVNKSTGIVIYTEAKKPQEKKMIISQNMKWLIIILISIAVVLSIVMVHGRKKERKKEFGEFIQGLKKS